MNFIRVCVFGECCNPIIDKFKNSQFSV